jgi:hypothetical protein
MSLMSRFKGSLPSLVFLAILVGTTGLLISGYGLPVGLGVLGGLILGFLAGLVGSLWTFRGSSQITFGSGSGSYGTWNTLSEDSSRSPESVATQVQELTEVLGVDLGGVRSIIPVMTLSEAGGLAVELVDLELREAGVALILDVRVMPGTQMPPSMARVSIADDVGTAYRASAQSQGGYNSPIRAFVVAIPAPPSSATKLSIRIEEFLDPPFPHAAKAIAGPWVYSVPLPAA